MNPSTFRIVLDTHVVLDWLVFRDPRMLAMAQGLEDGTLVWLASPPMRDELGHVLERECLQRWAPDAPAVMAHFDARAQLRSIAEQPPVPALRCSDPDDQPFIDLAVAERADWLVTRDRALLRLARAAGARGVAVLTPERWCALRSDAG